MIRKGPQWALLIDQTIIRVPQANGLGTISASDFTFLLRRTSDAQPRRLFSVVRQYALPWGVETSPCDWCWSDSAPTL